MTENNSTIFNNTLSYKDKKEIAKQLKRNVLKQIYSTDFNLLNTQAVTFDKNVFSLNNDIDLSSYMTAGSLVLKAVLLRHLLLNSEQGKKFINLLNEIREESDIK